VKAAQKGNIKMLYSIQAQAARINTTRFARKGRSTLLKMTVPAGQALANNALQDNTKILDTIEAHAASRKPIVVQERCTSTELARASNSRVKIAPPVLITKMPPITKRTNASSKPEVALGARRSSTATASRNEPHAKQRQPPHHRKPNNIARTANTFPTLDANRVLWGNTKILDTTKAQAARSKPIVAQESTT